MPRRSDVRTTFEDEEQHPELSFLPSDWQVPRISDLFDMRQGKALSPRARQGKSPRPFLRTSNVFWNRIDLSTLDRMDFDDDEVKKYDLQKGDLLVCEGGDVGRTAIWEGQLPTCMYQNHLHRLRRKDERVEPAFYAFWMQAAITQLGLYIGESNRTTIPNLSQGRLGGFHVPLPSRPEQRGIAHVLRTIQRAKESTELVIAGARQLKQSLMRHLFTYGFVPIDQADGIELKETEVGILPSSWQVSRISDLFHLQQGKALSPRARLGKSPRPFLRTANVLWGQVDLSVLDKMDFSDSEVEKLRLQAGDLLVCEGGDIGRTALWDGKVALCLYQNHIHRLRKKNDLIEPSFYMYWMQVAITQFGLYVGRGNRTTIPNLSQARLGAFPVPLPPSPEQRAIADILINVDRKLETESGRKASLESLFKTLLHQLVTGQLRVSSIMSIGPGG